MSQTAQRSNFGSSRYSAALRRKNVILYTGFLGFVALSIGRVGNAQVIDPVTAASAPIAGAGHNYIGNGAEVVNPADGSVSFHLPIKPPASELTAI
jgi:hypothetical protein